ncbi:carboxymuconolactone decarboxylase family protein [Flavobacterium sp.]|uniref:carboxymuconolactone decarboxylase family protein n=1 Tax=Flavobacterium sp. TaxID=239 RepID=UPI00286EDB33|nr:carboxymuconolactone decarboxylase family protein [Flavobacterium sp.]
MKHYKIIGSILLWSILLFTNSIKAQQMISIENGLSQKEKSIIIIAAETAKGDLANLKIALADGLNTGLTVNEIKEILVHTYAYCGFPRSIRGLQTFMEVMNDRKTKGIVDPVGKEASVVKEDGNKYERGKKILATLTQTPAPEKIVGYAAFAPIIDTFLKEHLFASIFERDVLTYRQREWVTLSVISAIGDAEPMLKGHLSIALNLGVSPKELEKFIEVIQPTIGKNKSNAAQLIINEVLKSK